MKRRKGHTAVSQITHNFHPAPSPLPRIPTDPTSTFSMSTQFSNPMKGKIHSIIITLYFRNIPVFTFFWVNYKEERSENSFWGIFSLHSSRCGFLFISVRHQFLIPLEHLMCTDINLGTLWPKVTEHHSPLWRHSLYSSVVKYWW